MAPSSPMASQNPNGHRYTSIPRDMVGSSHNAKDRQCYRGRTPLPTRVNNACQRCRRNKSRCDPFRPCSLCVRADAECLPSSGNDSSHPRKRPRFGEHRNGSFKSSHPTPPSETATNELFAAEEAETPTSREEHPPTAVLRDGFEDTPNSNDTDHTVDYGEAESAMGIARKIFRLDSQHIDETAISAIPGGDISGNPSATTGRDRNHRRPLSSVLGCALPTVHVMQTLLEEYFDTVHWFSLVVYEPKFRTRLQSIEDGFARPSQKPFLILLSTMLGMAAWYRSQKTAVESAHPSENWENWRLHLFKNVESHLVELMNQSSITCVQVCCLLGSYYVYHGRPNLSFALLGATIKTSQAIGLHRELLSAGFDDSEERKRVWWTIYTWDRFASITYARPIGINDKDCNVSMPTDVYESPYFKGRTSRHDGSSICYSAYQRELNKLYMIASPIIETVFGTRTRGSVEQVSGNPYTTLVKDVAEQLCDWRQRLPPYLVLDMDRDSDLNASVTLRIHRLQALALQLSFDNLLIILHRPFLAQQVDFLTKSAGQALVQAYSSPQLSTSTYFSAPYTDNPDRSQPNLQSPSSEQWWNAAVRTSRVTELPQLAQLATDSHLVAFLAINLFNAAIVMVVMAFSDPLSDRAQEAKRAITRIYRLQELLGKRSMLSMQSSIVLKKVIHMLLRREAEAMLAPITSLQTIAGETPNEPSESSHPALISVEDTLRLPLNVPVDLVNYLPGDQEHTNVNRAMRLNESLASIQKALPNSHGFQYFGGSGSGVGGQGQGTSQYAQERDNDAWLYEGTCDSSVPREGELAGDESGFDVTGNGLYWFWDTAWGEPHT